MREFRAVNDARRRPTKLALVAVGLAVSALFGYLAVRDVHFGRVWDVLRESNYWWTIPSVAALVAALLLRALRWQFLFAPETRPGYRPVLDATILGQFFNNILPARAGEAARIIALHRSARVSRAETTATVLVERAYDVLSLLVLLFVAVPWLPEVTWLRAAAIFGIALAGAMLAGFFLLWRYGERPLLVLLRPLARLPFVSAERVDRVARNLAHGAVALHRARLALLAFALTSVSWLLLALSSWVLTLGFGLDLSFGAGLLAVIAVGLSLILPSSPAAVGVFEAATLVALGAYGVENSEALSYALVLHAVNFVPYIAAGLLVLNLGAVRARRRARTA